MGDEFIDLELAAGVVVNKGRELATALDSTEGTALPNAAGDELECYKAMFVRSTMA